MNGASDLPSYSLEPKLLKMLKVLGSVFRWLMTWVYFVLVICFVGAVLGVFTHVVFGLLFLDGPDYSYLAAFGFQNGLRYGGVWAGGFSIVLCVMRARKEYLARHPEEGALG